MSIQPHQLAAMIDHTLLKPDATAEQIVQLCREAMKYGFWSVCVNPYWVPLAKRTLNGSEVKICTVIGFPLGATATRSKSAEAAEAIEAGASEVDMVLNIGALKSGDLPAVAGDIAAVVQTAGSSALVKVILETGFLTSSEKEIACRLSLEAGADFVKTSTGFGPGGATVADIQLMRNVVGPAKGVKASGGVRDVATALAMIAAGASRIGTSSGIAIIAPASASDSKAGY